jgi:hypothetical protein
MPRQITVKLKGDKMKSLPIGTWIAVGVATAIALALGFGQTASISPNRADPADAPAAAASGKRAPIMQSPYSGVRKPPTDVSSLPVYPGGTDLQQKELGPNDQVVTYRAQAGIPQLRHYYGQALAAQGWLPRDPGEDLTLTDTSVAADPNRSYSYIWGDETQLPYKLDLTVLFNFESAQSTVPRLIVRRTPILDKLTAYPGATQVETHYDKEMAYPPGFDIKVTTYETGAQTNEVEAYLLENLPKLGWVINDTQPTATDTIVFGYVDSPGPGGHFGIQGTFSLLETAQGTTRIVLRVHGTGIDAQNSEEVGK